MKTQQSISQILREYVESDNVLSGPQSKFSGKDFLSLSRAMDPKETNFIVFNNAGGKPFEVWFWDDMNRKNHTIKEFKSFIEKQKGYVYMYKLGKKETIVQELINHNKKAIRYKEYLKFF